MSERDFDEEIGRGAAGKIAIEEPTDEKSVNIPLARFVDAHDVDDIGAIVGDVEDGGIDGGGGDAPVVFEADGYGGVGPVCRDGLDGIEPGVERGGVAACDSEIGADVVGAIEIGGEIFEALLPDGGCGEGVRPGIDGEAVFEGVAQPAAFAVREEIIGAIGQAWLLGRRNRSDRNRRSGPSGDGRGRWREWIRNPNSRGHRRSGR